MDETKETHKILFFMGTHKIIGTVVFYKASGVRRRPGVKLNFTSL